MANAPTDTDARENSHPRTPGRNRPRGEIRVRTEIVRTPLTPERAHARDRAMEVVLRNLKNED